MLLLSLAALPLRAQVVERFSCGWRDDRTCPLDLSFIVYGYVIA